MKKKGLPKAWLALLRGSISPLVIGILFFVLFWLIYQIHGVHYKKDIDKVFISFVILFVTYWVFKIVVSLFNWYAVNIAVKTETKLDDQFIPLFRRLSVTIIWALGLIVLLARLGININAFVATLGVTSLAIALAAQDTIANIISGFLIMIDRPFSIGDNIKLPTGEKVKVIDIGIRRSKFICEEDKSIIIVPNVDLSKSKIVNYTYAENT